MIPELSIVVPVYGSEDSLRELVQRVDSIMKQQGVSYEIVAINDCSLDQSLEVLKQLVPEYPKLKVISLAYNVGQQAATLCGIKHASGRLIATLDDDLQYPPEELHSMLFVLNKTNLKLVYGYGEYKQSNFRVLAKQLIYFISGLSLQLSSYRLMRNEVVSELRQTNSYTFLLDALIKRRSNPHSFVSVKKQARRYGKSNYSFKDLVVLWTQFLFASSRFGETMTLLLLAGNIYFLTQGELALGLVVVLIASCFLTLTFLLKWRERKSYEVKEIINF